MDVGTQSPIVVAREHDRDRSKLFLPGAQEVIDRQFGLLRIALDYLFPAFLAAVAGLIPVYALVHPELLADYFDAEVSTGMLFGTAGAYVYVIMLLGERTFQRDITTGIATWSAVQLVLGPVLGGVVAGLLIPGTQFGDYTRQVIYFFAGLAPREMVNFVAAVVRRSLASGQAALKIKLIPLQSIRGINQRIEDRLFEEGITDGYMLAMAHPIRLYRNTPYDLRQILCWIDECLLYAQIPEYAEAIQKEGICGAIDLAYHWEMGPNQTPADAVIAQLAERINFDAVMLKSAIRRLYEDAQVQLIWCLYQTSKDD
jgi:hypothetical protein